MTDAEPSGLCLTLSGKEEPMWTPQGPPAAANNSATARSSHRQLDRGTWGASISSLSWTTRSVCSEEHCPEERTEDCRKKELTLHISLQQTPVPGPTVVQRGHPMLRSISISPLGVFSCYVKAGYFRTGTWRSNMPRFICIVSDRDEAFANKRQEFWKIILESC